MAPPLLVPDASVLLKWVLPHDDEPDMQPALQLRAAITGGTARALIPSLWFYEVGNTLARRVPDRAAALITALMNFGLPEASPSGGWIARALELTTRHKVTFNDAAYHALALLNDGLFVTADERYVAAASAAGSVVTLTAWEPTHPPRRGARPGG